MCRRLLLRAALFLVLFIAICAAAAWVDDLAVPRHPRNEHTSAVANESDLCEDDMAHNAIAAGAAVLVAATFLLTVGTCRRTPDSQDGRQTAGRGGPGGTRDGQPRRSQPSTGPRLRNSSGAGEPFKLSVGR